MKKILAFAIIAVMAFSLLTGCGDPVAAELEEYLNVDMVDANINYEVITTELATWETLETDEALISSIKDKLIPVCDETLAIVGKIELETEEVKTLKDKFAKVIELYKEGFEYILSAAETGNEEGIANGDEKIAEGLVILDEYNSGLESLAAEYGLTIEY